QAAVGGCLGGAAGTPGNVQGADAGLQRGQLLQPRREELADVVAAHHDRRPDVRRRPARLTTWPEPPSVVSSSALSRSRARNSRTFTAPGVKPIAVATSSVDCP